MIELVGDFGAKSKRALSWVSLYAAKNAIKKNDDSLALGAVGNLAPGD